MLITAAQIKPKSFESRRNSLFFLCFSLSFLFEPGASDAHVLRACFNVLLLPQSLVLIPFTNLTAGTDVAKLVGVIISVDRCAKVTELRSCVKTEVAVLGSPSLKVLMVSVDAKQY